MGKVMCIFAHPDDEAFGPGGTIAMLAKNNDVKLICCTDGDHLHSGLKQIRNQELLSSAQILGINEVIFLDYPDGSLCNNLYPKLSSELKQHLDVYQPDTLITFAHNGVSGHLDHILVSSVVQYLFPTLSYVKKLMLYHMRDLERQAITDYFVYMPDGLPKSLADEVVDVTSVWDQVIQAINSHQSQKTDIDRMISVYAGLPKEEYFLVRSK